MKKVLLIALGLVMGVGSYAQESEGGANKMWIGGTASFGTDNIKDGQGISNYEFGPSFGYMLNEKMAVGINLTFDGNTTTRNNNDNDVDKESGYNIAPFFRYYFAGAGNFKFYGDVNVSFGGGTDKTESDNANNVSESKYSTFGFGINPGVQYWFTDNWSMASTIGLLDYSSKTDNKGDNNEFVKNKFDVGATFSTLNFSFFYHF